nr:MAG TPA: hypothetical protein [Caudoviricetes sp.]
MHNTTLRRTCQPIKYAVANFRRIAYFVGVVFGEYV